MGFLDLFRPRWRHSDVEIREQAVRYLGTQEIDILVEVAEKDRDVRVRRIAIKKLEDPRLLRTLAARESDAELRQVAESKAAELFLAAALAEDDSVAQAALAELTGDKELATVAKRGASVGARRGALARISGHTALVEVARRGTDEAVRLEALARVHDDEALTEVALAEDSRAIALAAVARVEDRAALLQISKSAKNKAARAAAKEKLPREQATPAAAAPEASELRKQLLRLCLTAEQQAGGADLATAATALDETRAAFESAGREPGTEALEKRFYQTIEKFAARRETAERAAREAAAKAKKSKGGKAERKDKKAEGEAGSDAGAGAAAATPAVAAVVAAVVAAPVAAAAAPVAAAPPREPTAEELAAREADAARRREDKVKRDAARAELVTSLTRACDRIEAALEADDMKAATSALKAARNDLKESRPSSDEAETKVRARFQALSERATRRGDELREADSWKRWANLPAFEQLVKEAEALAEVIKDAPDKRRAPGLLKELQERWRAAGAPPQGRSQEMWERFKKACDAVYESSKEFLGKLDENRDENLKKKLGLCEKAEAVAGSTDWKETATVIKALQDEWQAIGEVPKAESDTVWNRFRAACDKFFEARRVVFEKNDKEREGNLVRKEKACAELEALAKRTGAADREAAVARCKELFAEWPSIGPVPKEKTDAVWNRFKAVCDAILQASAPAAAAPVAAAPVVAPVVVAPVVAAPAPVVAAPAPVVAAPAPVVAAPAPVVVAPAPVVAAPAPPAPVMVAAPASAVVAAPEAVTVPVVVKPAPVPAPAPAPAAEPSTPAVPAPAAKDPAVDDGWD